MSYLLHLLIGLFKIGRMLSIPSAPTRSKAQEVGIGPDSREVGRAAGLFERIHSFPSFVGKELRTF